MDLSGIQTKMTGKEWSLMLSVWGAIKGEKPSQYYC